MGIIFSKPRDYVARKVDGCKRAIRQKVDDTKSAILNKLHSSVQSVKLCLVTTKDDIVGSIVGVKDNICGKITRKVNCVCTACRNTRDNVVGKVVYVQNSVINTKNAVVDSVVSTKNGIINKYTNTKNYIKNTYTHSTNAIKQKYSDIKNTNLTKCQKLKYSLFGLVILWMMYIFTATLFDLYVGNFTRVEERFCSIRDNVCTISYHIYTYTGIIITQSYIGLRYTVIYVWKYSRVFFKHTYQYLTEVKSYFYDTSKDAVHYIINVINLTFETILYYFLETCSYTWIGLCYISDLIYQLLLLLSEHITYYSKIGCENFKLGSKVAYKHTKVWLLYSFKHGSVFLKDVSHRGSHYMYYLLTDFKHASVDGLFWSWASAKQLTYSTAQGIVESSQIAYYYFCFSISFLYESIISFSSWSYDTSFKLSDAFLNACFYIYTAILDSSTKAWDAFVYTSANTSQAIMLSGVYLYDKMWAFIFLLCDWSITVHQSLINASIFIYNQISYFMNEYGFEWLHKLKTFTLHSTTILFTALSKFFLDLTFIIYKFVTVTSDRIYNITYFIFFIIFKVLHISSGSFKLILSSLVILMNLMFASIVSLMKFAIVAYSSILSSYNHYRESIFFSIVTLISIYCVSVAKDRKMSEEKYLLELEINDDNDDTDFEKSGEENEENDDEDFTDQPTHADVDFDSSFSHDDDEILWGDAESIGAVEVVGEATFKNSPITDKERALERDNAEAEKLPGVVLTTV